MRRGIYYWKCDCPRPDHERAASFTAAKYDHAAIDSTVRKACRSVLGCGPDTVTALRCAGDHYAYRVNCAGRDLLFRAAADTTGDDYMLAEAALCNLAQQAGVPVPRILHTAAEPGSALRWQLMEFTRGDTLRDLHRDGRLDLERIAQELGRLLRRLHSVPIADFGFIDTDLLRERGIVRGLYHDYRSYVHCRLEDHLTYVEQHGLLPAGGGERTRRVFAHGDGLLERPTAVLVHRDPTLWNLIGGSDHIAALIDWDDAVGGDPADDLSILRCLHDEAFTSAAEQAYWAGDTPPADIEARIRLHTLRNMLWKAQIRHQLGYFRPGAATFLDQVSGGVGVEAATRSKLAGALALAEEIA